MGAERSTDKTKIAIDFGGYPATVTAPIRLLPTLRSTLVDLVRLDGNTGAEITIVATDDGDRVLIDGRGWKPGGNHSIVDQVMYVLLRASLDAFPGCLHLHAAYLAMGRNGVLLAGLPGSGKSTLASRLVEAGFDYLTDERVRIDPDGRLRAVAKPISLMQGSFAPLAHLDPKRTGSGYGDTRTWHVPASAIRTASVTGEATPTHLFFVAYERDADFAFSAVEPADAVQMLLADSPDAIRSGALGLLSAATLCAGLSCFQVRYGDKDDTMAAIADLVQTTNPPAEIRVRAVPTTTERTLPGAAPDVRRMRADVSAVVIGERCVLRRGDGAILALDQLASSWLQLIDGRTATATIVRDVAETNAIPTSQVDDVARQVIDGLIDGRVLE